MDKNQDVLFNTGDWWHEYWQGMPEFSQEDLMPDSRLIINFATNQDRKAFARLIGQRISRRTRSTWYPEAKIESFLGKAYKTEARVLPKYPIYIISKGRQESRHTSKALEAICVPYRIVIEPQEYKQYAEVIDPKKILVLPFSNLGQGSIPARNWVWEHSVSEGHKRHWILDDNIRGFFRLNNNLKVPVKTGATFRAIEIFSDRYINIGISGMNYFMFAKRKDRIPPITLNTRIYSCILIENSIPFRWRGRYNEDTDLCLRALKSRLCTVLFNAFLCFKEPTMSCKGGNTESLYMANGRYKMAESLRDQHPDVVTITEKWGRPQHHVDYRPFKDNKLILRDDCPPIKSGIDNFGMFLDYEDIGTGR